MIKKDNYCIIGTGRSGSSLLSTIMAKSGADFQITIDENWDPVEGSMEHPFCIQAYRNKNQIRKLIASILPAKYCFLYFFKKKYQKILKKLITIKYLKSTMLVWLVPDIANAGLNPKVIISFRDFQGYAMSRHKKSGVGFNELAETYLDTYMTAWLQLKIYGGVIIDFNDICNENETEWARSISQLTGLDQNALIMNRNSLLKSSKSRSDDNLVGINDKIQYIEKLFVKNKNLIFKK